jgi:hypothetical protein
MVSQGSASQICKQSAAPIVIGTQDGSHLARTRVLLPEAKLVHCALMGERRKPHENVGTNLAWFAASIASAERIRNFSCDYCRNVQPAKTYTL